MADKGPVVNAAAAETPVIADSGPAVEMTIGKPVRPGLQAGRKPITRSANLPHRFWLKPLRLKNRS